MNNKKAKRLRRWLRDRVSGYAQAPQRLYEGVQYQSVPGALTIRISPRCQRWSYRHLKRLVESTPVGGVRSGDLLYSLIRNSADR